MIMKGILEHYYIRNIIKILSLQFDTLCDIDKTILFDYIIYYKVNS